MRRNIWERLEYAPFDPKEEFRKLWTWLHEEFETDQCDETSIYEILSEHFREFPVRYTGRFLSINEFQSKCGYDFDRRINDATIDDLVDLCEFTLHMLLGYMNYVNYPLKKGQFDPARIEQYISKLMQDAQYIAVRHNNSDNQIYFVHRDPVAIAVAENDLIPEEFSWRIIEYPHHRMKGNIEAKRIVLDKFAQILEGKRKQLATANSRLEADLFDIFNKLHIRHNNIDTDNPAKYNEATAKMPEDEREMWFDEIYQMCLMAFMSIEQKEREVKISTLRDKLDSPK